MELWYVEESRVDKDDMRVVRKVLWKKIVFKGKEGDFFMVE